jgi:AbrB family looped-hinge helix DNA binding protein
MAKTRIVRQLRHGQITIPKEFRDALHLEPDDLLAVTLDDGKLALETVRPTTKSGGSQWVRRLYDLYAPAREALAASGLTEDEINAEIDTALREVRGEQ